MANSKGLFISGIILGIVGIILFVISFALFPTVLRNATESAIKSNVIVDSRKSTRYNDWKGQQSVDNYYKQYYYAWNLTNPNEFLNGEKPIFNQIGPFNYKYLWSYSNVTFLENGNMVQYVNKKSYIQQQDDETFDPDMIEITNINPAFLGLLSQLQNNANQIGASSEELLFILGSGPQMNQFIQDLSTSNFTQIAYFFNGPTSFKSRYDLIIQSLNESNPQDYFLEQWANATSIPIENDYIWTDMLVSYGLDQPLGISLESARMILDPNNTASILNLSSGIFLWLNSTINSSIQQSLANQLNISITQLLLIRSWYMNQFNPQFTQSLLLETCNIPTMDYLGLCQFVTTIPLGYQSISAFNDYLSPNWIKSLPTPFEIPSLAGSNVSFSVMNASKYLFSENDENSLLSIQGIGNFASQYSGNQNFTVWNINSNDAQTLFSYIFGMLPESYSENFIKSFYSTSGLIVTKTVNDWLWNCNDPLLQVLGIDNNCALQLNNTIFKPSTIYTGKNDTSKTNQYYKYQNETILSAWNQGEPVNVTGFAETGQFPPLGGIPNSLTMFEENILRPVELLLNGPSQVEGINTQRYYLQNNSLPIDPSFNSSIQGFANLTGIKGLPLFVSLWDMYEVPPQYSGNLIPGLNQTWENAQIPLDLEPITGNALYFNLKLQINLGFPNNSNYFEPNGKWSGIHIPSDTGLFMPSFKIGLTAQPSNSTVDLIKSQFKEIQIVKVAPVVVFAIFGGILVVASIIMSSVGFRRIFIRKGYHQIN
ncbi:hypothetical protein DICPUDRAFT_147188 [Dictyostelium purpureum]|uniref:Uncharacterized protein n=1 Tax=Dictyostelium purpureum TaxID=5786 RepID=F0Z7W3_DICPU|nr:uncharacterized protein DICPUDRAFT_147188 [Dictyostelium purpureum]EGC40017.1 hypothetical protein DICPUDRAFT_147188 [Dictyostelium purpureum]|eukprot:XP_003283520.1 hypothetical protein DICPUDRAFT_147188 [Dictyostelium purpureum]